MVKIDNSAFKTCFKLLYVQLIVGSAFLRPCFGQFHPDLSGIFVILFAPGAFGVGHYSRWAIIRRWGIIFSKSVKMGYYWRWAIIRDWGII